jgi:hypothetical protein
LLGDSEQRQHGAQPHRTRRLVGIAGAEGLGEVIAGVDEEHVGARDGGADQVHQHFVTQRRRDGQVVAELACRPTQHPPGLLHSSLVCRVARPGRRTAGG